MGRRDGYAERASERTFVGNPLASTDFDTVRAALADGRDPVRLSDVSRRFVDLKTAYGDPRALAVNARHDGSLARRGLPPAELDRALAACRIEEAPDGLARWLAYQAFESGPVELSCAEGVLCFEELVIDCDGSKSAHVVPRAVNGLYDLLWPDARAAGADSADTMSSAWTTLGAFLRLALEPAVREELGSRRWNKANVVDALRRSPRLRALVADGRVGVDGGVGAQAGRQVELLCYLTHTLGNLIVCPAPFNPGRYPATADYWDLTLMALRPWFEGGSAGEDGPLGRELRERCRPWLGLDGCQRGADAWERFIRDNFLWPYVDDRLAVRPFFAGHGLERRMPGEGDILDCLLSMNAAIIARGNLMLHEIARRKGRERDGLLPLVTPVGPGQLAEEAGGRVVAWADEEGAR